VVVQARDCVVGVRTDALQVCLMAWCIAMLYCVQ
jgi:hypothetical protein